MEDQDTSQKSAPKTSKTIAAKLPINWDRSMSLLAVGLSITAILVSFAEVTTVRAHSKATVWPHISVKQNFSDAGYELNVANKGVGPALIQDVRFIVDGELVTDLDAAIIDALGPEEAFSYETYRVADITNSVLAARENVNTFSVPWNDQTRKLSSRWNNKVDLEICYCSIQEDCWRTSLVSQDTVKLDDCSVTGDRLTSLDKIVVNPNDFAPLVGANWVGSLSYKDYGSGKLTKISVEADVAPVSKNTIVYTLRYPNESSYNATQKIRISKDGTRIDGEPIISRERDQNGDLRITTQSRGTDNNRPADIRMTYVISRTSFQILQAVKYDDSATFFERNRYNFAR